MPESTDITTTISSSARAAEARADTGAVGKSVTSDANAAATTVAARSRSFARGVICALIGGALWGLSGACSQFLLSNYDITPLFITCVRMAGSGILLLALLLATRRDTLRRMVRDRITVRQLALFGIGGLFLCQITYVVAISYTNAGTATVLQSTATVVIMAVTCAKARKLPSKSEAVGLACALAAVWLIATQGNPGAIMLPALGLIWGAANALSVSFYIMYPRRLFTRWGSLPTTGCGMIIGGIAACALWAGSSAWQGSLALPSLDAAGIAVLAVIVLFGTFAAFALYLHGVSIVGPVAGGLLGTVEPASATVCSALWLSTVFSAADWAGFALMMAMIVLVAVSKKG